MKRWENIEPPSLIVFSLKSRSKKYARHFSKLAFMPRKPLDCEDMAC